MKQQRLTARAIGQADAMMRLKIQIDKDQFETAAKS